MPSTLQGLLLSRIDRLAAPARRLLQEAAVLGADFDAALLRAVATSRRPTRRSKPWSRPTAAAGRAEAGPLPLHPRAGARGGLPEPAAARRTELHQRVGRALEVPPARSPSAWPTSRRSVTTSACARRAARGAAICWPPATGRAASTRTRTRCATTSAPLAHAGRRAGAAATRMRRAAPASAWATCWRLDRAPRRGARALRGRAARRSRRRR